MKCQVCSKLADLLADLPPVDMPVTGNFRFLLYELFLADQVADLPPIDLPVNGNFRFLLYELFLADQVADLPPPIEHRSLEHHYTESVDMY